MSNKWVTIATVSQPLDAHVLKGKLEAEGIEAFLADENIVSMNFLYSNAVGGVKVQVDEEDVEEALQIIGEALPPLELVDPIEEELPCPKCGGTEFKRDRHPFALAIQILTLGLALGKKSQWKCAKCGEPVPN